VDRSKFSIENSQKPITQQSNQKGHPRKIFFNTIGRFPAPSFLAGGGRRSPGTGRRGGGDGLDPSQLPGSGRPFKFI
jgi:hypothetical protein